MANFMKRVTAAAITLALIPGIAAADTTIVDDNFDGYASNADFLNVWGETIGNGSAPAGAGDADSGVITSDATIFPGIQGQAVDHLGAASSFPGMVNQYGGVINQGAGMNPAFSIAPSASQSVFASVDIYDGASGNERMSLGLRNISVSGTTVTTTNLLELGFYNSNSADVTVAGATNPAQNATAGSPGFYTGRGYGARLNLYGPVSSPLLQVPDWQYFRTDGETWGTQSTDLGFDIGLDRIDDTDDVVTIADIGAGWHRYTATITPTEVEFTIDLFRDDLRNTSTVPDGTSGIRPGTPGVDARMVFPIETLPGGFNSLRIGGPSGLTSAGTGDMAFDNVLLQLIDVVAPEGNADFDGSGLVDGADFLRWQRNYPVNDGTALMGDGDANGDGNVNDVDLGFWQSQFGTSPAAPIAAAVPEPATIALSLLAAAALFARRGAKRT